LMVGTTIVMYRCIGVKNFVIVNFVTYKLFDV
jgi:hypothetical protein